MSKTLLAIRHVAFEDLGGFEGPLADAGFSIRYADMGIDRIADFGDPDLLVVLGGPIGVYEDEFYPWLTDEIAFIAARLKAQKPILGICLGAQLMARALGARVYPGPAKEIGWKPLSLTREGEDLLAPLADQPVLHWHGDTLICRIGLCFWLRQTSVAIRLTHWAVMGLLSSFIRRRAGRASSAG